MHPNGYIGRGRQKGVALLVVLTIFALAASLAAAILYRQDHFRVRTANLLNWDQRYQYALSVEAIAIQGLQLDLEQDSQSNSFVDSCAFEQWAVALPPTPYGNALVSASVQDLNARFNLNWVVTSTGKGFVQNADGIKMLTRLLRQLLADPAKAQTFAFEMADWIDSNSLVDGVYGAEDGGYRLQRTPNLPVVDASEMRALKGFKASDLKGPLFWQYFSALPVTTTLNINDAPPKVLDAVIGQVAGSDAVQAVVDLRQKGPISSVDQLLDDKAFASLSTQVRDALKKRLSVNSSYFEVMTDVNIGGQYTRLVSRFKREQGASTAVYSRELVARLGPLEAACNPVYNSADNGATTMNAPGG